MIRVHCPFYLDSRCTSYLCSRVHDVCARACVLRVVTVMRCVLHSEGNCMRILNLIWRIQSDVVLCENCVLAEGCLLEVNLGAWKNAKCPVGVQMLHIHLVQRSIVYTCCGAAHVVEGQVPVWRGFCYAVHAWHEKTCPIEPVQRKIQSNWCVLMGTTEFRTPSNFSDS